jgi:hypothetical protein
MTADDWHTFFSAQTVGINVTCSNGTNASYVSNTTTYYIANNTILANLTTISDGAGIYNFSNGTLIESSNVSIRGECSGNIFTLKQINVTYSNGTLVQSTNDEVINLSYSVLNDDDNYNVTMTCITDEGNSVKSSKYFTLNDTVSPGITWSDPLSDNSSSTVQYSSRAIVLSTTDTNLFSIMVNCSIGGYHLYDYYKENLSGNYFQINNVTGNNTIVGTVICSAVAKDRHTKEDISQSNITFEQIDSYSSVDSEVIDSKDVRFMSSDDGLSPAVVISLENFDELQDIKVVKEKDRYTFEPIIGNKKNLPQELVYEISCDQGILYFWDDRSYNPKKQKYGKYFGCGDFWIDFHIDGLRESSYSVTELEQGRSYKIRIKLSETDKLLSLRSSSIGVKNTAVSDVSYSVTPIPVSSAGTSIDMTTGNIYLCLILIWITLLFVGFLFMKVLIVMDCVLGIFIGIGIFMIYPMIAFTYIAINIVLMMAVVIMFND